MATKLSRSVAQGLADHLNAVLNRTVSDSRLSVRPIIGHPAGDDAFDLTRVVEEDRVPLELDGTTARLFVRLVVVVVGDRCRTESYVFRFQEDDSRKSWLRRWEYHREPPAADYPYALGHLHVRGTSPDGASIDREHIPAGGRGHPIPLEEIIRYLIADRGVKSEKDDWKAILEESEKTFHN
jgi:hypothetical protein